MRKLNYGGLFQDWEIGVAKNLINEFRQKWKHMKREGFNDLLQECLWEWFRNRHKYDSDKKASQETYMANIVRNKLIKIQKRIYAKKRKAFYDSESLDKPIKEGEVTPSQINKIPVNVNPADLLIKSELDSIISKTIQKLTSRKKSICELIKDGLKVTEICEKLNFSRTMFYKELKQIEEFFIRERLKDFWEEISKNL